jgi:hypothetical protein
MWHEKLAKQNGDNTQLAAQIIAIAIIYYTTPLAVPDQRPGTGRLG